MLELSRLICSKPLPRSASAMAMALRSLALAWLLDAALGGSGCNEQVKAGSRFSGLRLANALMFKPKEPQEGKRGGGGQRGREWKTLQRA